MAIANFKIRSWAIVKRLLLECPLLIEVCDARDVPGSRTFKLEAGLRDKLIIAAVKADLVPGKSGVLEKTPSGIRIVYVSTKTGKGVELLRDILYKMADDKRARYEAKKRRRWNKSEVARVEGAKATMAAVEAGGRPPIDEDSEYMPNLEVRPYKTFTNKTGIRPGWAGGKKPGRVGGGPTVTHDQRSDDSLGILIFGMPNVGKSSLINALSGRRATQTGFRSGITRGPQWINLGKGMKLLDTPGVVDLQMPAEDMALHASLDAEKVKKPEDVAEQIIEKFLRVNDTGLFRHFGIEPSNDYEEILQAIARKRGLLAKGGEPKEGEAAKIVIREWQKGKFGLSGKKMKLTSTAFTPAEKSETEWHKSKEAPTQEETAARMLEPAKKPHVDRRDQKNRRGYHEVEDE